MLADVAQPVFLAMFCLAATAALVSVQESALVPRPVLRVVTTPFSLISRWFSRASAGHGQRAGDGRDMLLDNAATASACGSS